MVAERLMMTPRRLDAEEDLGSTGAMDGQGLERHGRCRAHEASAIANDFQRWIESACALTTPVVHSPLSADTTSPKWPRSTQLFLKNPSTAVRALR
jgi:hypothetical protein